jgi:CheY-like chemotaxis protein
MQDAPAKGPAILLADDEEGSRTLLVTALRRSGFEVLEASCGLEALALFDANASRICLLVTDVMMPDLRGPDVAARLRLLMPALPVLYVTGYSERQGIDRDDQLMHKPFTASSFFATVKGILR